MMMILKLQIKLLPNLVGWQGYVLTVWYGDPGLEIMLLDDNEPTNYEETMVGPDSD